MGGGQPREYSAALAATQVNQRAEERPSQPVIERSEPGYWSYPAAPWWTGLAILGAIIGIFLLVFSLLYFFGPKTVP